MKSRFVPAAFLVTVVALAACSPSLAPPPGRWTEVAAPPEGLMDAALVALPGGNALLAGGRETIQGPSKQCPRTSCPAELARALLFNGATNSWEKLPDMPEPRAAAMVVRLANGQALIAGGYGARGQILADSLLFDPQRHLWLPAGTMAVGRAEAGLVALADGDALIAGGTQQPAFFSEEGPPIGGSTQAIKSAEVFHLATRSWSPTAAMTQARLLPAATLLADGRVLAAGGSDGTDLVSAVEIYDPRTGSWSTAAPLPQPRGGATAIPLSGDRVLVTGGTTVNGQGTFTGNPALDAEVFDVRSNRWNVGSEINTSDRFTLLQGVTPLRDGRILAMIVYLGSAPETAAYAYDPGADFWSQASIPPRLSFNATAVTLSDGRVLLAAGEQAAIYDPTAPSRAPTEPPRGVADSSQTTTWLAIVLALVAAVILIQRWLGSRPRASKGQLSTPTANTAQHGENQHRVAGQAGRGSP